MSNDFGDERDELERIVMTDDEGGETEFFVINAGVSDKVRYLLVVECSEYDKEEPDAYIIKEVGENGSELSFEFVEDDSEYEAACVLLTDEDFELKM